MGMRAMMRTHIKSVYYAIEKGDKAAAEAATGGGSNSFRNFMIGLFMGVFAYLLVLNREKVIAMAKSLSTSNKGGQ